LYQGGNGFKMRKILNIGEIKIWIKVGLPMAGKIVHHDLNFVHI